METEAHHLQSEHVGDEFVISIARASKPDEEPSQVLFVTDPVGCFGAVTDMARIQAQLGKLPPLWVIGVGYPVPTFADTFTLRGRDLTPTAVADEDFPGAGGAPTFLGFLREELFPWLAERHGIAADGAAYLGHSFGGLFGAWVLTHAPSTFARYGLSSPSLWWDDGVLFTQEAEYAAAHDDLAARVLISVGGLETPAAQAVNIARLPEADRAKERAEAAADTVDMVAGARLFADALSSRSYPSLESEFQILAGENHISAGYVGIGRALRYLWDLPD